MVCTQCDAKITGESFLQLDDEILCRSCADDETFVCNRCGERHWNDDNRGDDSIALCENCYNYHYTHCERCNRIIHHDDCFYLEDDDDDDYPYCCNCHAAQESETYLRNYGYKPMPCFYGEGERFFGVELEIDDGGKSNSHAHTLQNIANDCEERIYIKSDGSLDDGMEIRQEILLRDLGVDEVFIDKASGKNTDRPELKRMLTYVRQGDTVIVEAISRFARNTRDLLELVERLTAKGVEFVSKKEAIDTTTPTGKFMLTIFGAVAELEREYILQRQQEGIAIAKTQGKYKGRKPIEHPEFERVVIKWRDGRITATEAMRRLGMKRSTFYRKVKSKSVSIV